MELSYRRLKKITTLKLHVYEIHSEKVLVGVGSSMNHVEMLGGGGSPKVHNNS